MKRKKPPTLPFRSTPGIGEKAQSDKPPFIKLGELENSLIQSPPLPGFKNVLQKARSVGSIEPTNIDILEEMRRMNRENLDEMKRINKENTQQMRRLTTAFTDFTEKLEQRTTNNEEKLKQLRRKLNT